MKTIFRRNQKEYTSEAVMDLIDRYTQKGGEVITIEGCLVDNYILYGENLKTFVIREKPLNEWSSSQTLRAYNKTPKKYDEIIQLFLDEEEEKAKARFFA